MLHSYVIIFIGLLTIAIAIIIEKRIKKRIKDLTPKIKSKILSAMTLQGAMENQRYNIEIVNIEGIKQFVGSQIV